MNLKRQKKQQNMIINQYYNQKCIEINSFLWIEKKKVMIIFNKIKFKEKKKRFTIDLFEDENKNIELLE